MKTKLILLLIVLVFLNSCTNVENQDMTIIPKPVSIEAAEGSYTISDMSGVGFSDPSLSDLSEYLIGQLDKFNGIKLSNSDDPDIFLNHDKTLQKNLGN